MTHFDLAGRHTVASSSCCHVVLSTLTRNSASRAMKANTAPTTSTFTASVKNSASRPNKTLCGSPPPRSGVSSVEHDTMPSKNKKHTKPVTRPSWPAVLRTAHPASCYATLSSRCATVVDCHKTPKTKSSIGLRMSC